MKIENRFISRSQSSGALIRGPLGPQPETILGDKGVAKGVGWGSENALRSGEGVAGSEGRSCHGCQQQPVDGAAPLS